MQSWEIRPFDGVGPLNFGTPRSRVREALGSRFHTFRKSAKSQSETDAYGDLGLHLYYDAADQLKFIETFPSCALRWGNLWLFRADLRTTIGEMQASGQPAITDPSGCYFEGLGVAIYSPYDGRIESVGVFRRDEWEHYLELAREIAEKRRLRAERRKALGAPKNPFQSDEQT